MASKNIFLARHGDIGLGREKRYIGHKDLCLSETGKQQACILQQQLNQVSLDNIYCSDLTRSVQTARIIAEPHQLIPVVLEELRELNMGEWDGELFSDIKLKLPEEFAQRGKDLAHYCPLNGESFVDCSKRVIPIFENLVHTDDKNILIVGHAGVNRIILCHILGISLDRVFCLGQDYGCLNLIHRDGSKYVLKFLNHVQ